MKKIHVNIRDYGWNEPITVTRKENKIIVWCNHDNAETEEQETTSYSWNDNEITRTHRTLICDKCEAYKDENETYWLNTPCEGVR